MAPPTPAIDHRLGRCRGRHRPLPRAGRVPAFRRAFTLAEGLIASAVLAAAVVGIVAPLSASHQQADLSAQGALAVALGRQLLEEIAARPFTEADGSTHLGPSAGKTARAQYTSVGDYDGYADSTAALTTADGTALDLGLGGQVYRRAVAVQYLGGRAGPVAATGDYALVSVTVTPPAGPAVKLCRVVTRVNFSW